jgi:AcrR family transcriptional regulator
VLTTALEIADAEGLDAVSFRRISAQLRVTPMALYRYVESKEALLDGLADRVLAQLDLPPSRTGDWRPQLRTAAHSFRRLLIRHPSVVPIFFSRALFTPAAIRTADSLLGLLRRAGFKPAEAVLRYQQVVRFLLALVMLELESSSSASESERREKERIVRITLETLPRDKFPNLVEAAPYLGGSVDAEEAFDAGLDLLIAGLQRGLPRKPPRRTGRGGAP